MLIRLIIIVYVGDILFFNRKIHMLEKILCMLEENKTYLLVIITKKFKLKFYLVN